MLRKGRGYVTQASEDVPDRLHAYNMLRRNPLDTVFTGEFLGQIDPGVPDEPVPRGLRCAEARRR